MAGGRAGEQKSEQKAGFSAFGGHLSRFLN